VRTQRKAITDKRQLKNLCRLYQCSGSGSTWFCASLIRGVDLDQDPSISKQN
jgi:hypothetical protein